MIQGHGETHMGAEAIAESVRCYAIGVKKLLIAKSVSNNCEICLTNNPKIQIRSPLGEVRRGTTLSEYWQIDFSELPRCNQYQYLFVSVDTFFGWPEGLPCQTNKARALTRHLLKEIILRFGFPLSMSSNRGPHFVAEIIKDMSKILGIKWDLHTP